MSSRLHTRVNPRQEICDRASEIGRTIYLLQISKVLLHSVQKWRLSTTSLDLNSSKEWKRSGNPASNRSPTGSGLCGCVGMDEHEVDITLRQTLPLHSSQLNGKVPYRFSNTESLSDRHHEIRCDFSLMGEVEGLLTSELGSDTGNACLQCP
jgi:hypothetical protein